MGQKRPNYLHCDKKKIFKGAKSAATFGKVICLTHRKFEKTFLLAKENGSKRFRNPDQTRLKAFQTTVWQNALFVTNIVFIHSNC